MIDALRKGRVDRLAVDAIYSAYNTEKMSAPDIIYRDIRESGKRSYLILL